MTALKGAVAQVLRRQELSGKPLAVILAGHNGSGKTTMWYEHIVGTFQIPLINADRMMLSILPSVAEGARHPKWVVDIRDNNPTWMRVAQKGVEAFVAQAMSQQAPFAMETVFSYWEKGPEGVVKSKIDNILKLQEAGYFVILIFVGLSTESLSLARVKSRKLQGGHDVDEHKILSRFPRTQMAISNALPVADASILVDNSRGQERAFTPCRVQFGPTVSFDCRQGGSAAPSEILQWLEVVSPRI